MSILFHIYVWLHLCLLSIFLSLCEEYFAIARKRVGSMWKFSYFIQVHCIERTTERADECM